ncbi:MAG: hypothetical protein A2107_13800 [Verrucomicrobia bacterium GWF2_62_7]|nr:MAG: hypothetical protein A2107_13800 [Verrucomicrobia bacterium GWF2_62_7]
MEKSIILPQWIVVRLGNDMNWWVEKTSDEIFWPREGLSVLDPRQFRDIAERLGEYYAIGFQRMTFAKAFALFTAESELDEGRLRLKIALQPGEDAGDKLFALPLFVDDEQSTYRDLVDNLIGLRVKLLNKMHHYAHVVDDLELEEELVAKLNDRYFNGGSLHCYDEINEILSWSPAEWDGSDEADDKLRAVQEEDEKEEQS